MLPSKSIFKFALRLSVPILLCVSIAAPVHASPASGWTAQWITPAAESGTETNLWICFRKKFDLKSKPKAATARIAVDSRYWLWINGREAVWEGGLKRGPNPNDTYFDSIDLSPYLRAGSNTVAVLQWYWGRNGFSHKSSGKPGFLFEMKADGTTVKSDGTWKAILHPAYGVAGGRQPNYRISEMPIHFDARKDIGDWTAASFQDADWPAAVVCGFPPVHPWNNLHPRPIPFWKNGGLKNYANDEALPSESSGDPVSAILPYNAQVTPWLDIEAPEGLLIDMETDDPLSDIHSEYVTREGRQQFEGLAWMNGHTVLYHIPKGVKIFGLKYRETGYDTDFTGNFNCDQELFNRLWIKCRRTLYITMRDNFMDCPDRERAQWWGDAVNEIGETFYSLSPSSRLLARKAIHNVMDWRRPDKVIFSPVPAGNWDRELPTQMLATVGKYGFWTYCLYTGDLQTIKDVYPRVRDYLSIWQIDDQGLVVHRPGDWDWEDWGQNIDARVLDNAWFCLALESAANMADVCGNKNEANEYRSRRASIVRAVNERFWNGAAYQSSEHNGPPDDRANGLAVVAGLADAGKFPAILKVLQTQRWASPYMEKYVLEALMLMNMPDEALDRMRTRFTDIVNSPLTTLPEMFPTGGTNNHAWSGGPLTIMSQYFAGIAPLAPGYALYRVQPQMGELKTITAAVDTVKGKIDLKLNRKKDQFEMELTSPRDTSCVVCVPRRAEYAVERIEANGNPVWQNGKSTGRVRGIAYKSMDENYVRFTVLPGTWKIVARAHEPK